jgi:hypothetical protein
LIVRFLKIKTDDISWAKTRALSLTKCPSTSLSLDKFQIHKDNRFCHEFFRNGWIHSWVFLNGKRKIKWCVPFGTQRVETEGGTRSKDIEINPKADSRPGTNQA